MQFFYTQTVYAGVPLQLPYGGSYFLLSSAGVARKVGIQMTSDGQTSKIMQDMTTGFSLPVKFDAITFYSTVDTVVSFFASPGPVTLGAQDGAAVNVPGGVVVTNAIGQPVPIYFPGGVVNLTASNVGVNNTDAEAIPIVQKIGAMFAVVAYQAATVSNPAPIAVTAVAGALAAAASGRRGLRIKNAGANPVAIGGAGVVYATAAVIIQSGETWNENEAAPAAWYCICDAGMTSTLNIQTIA